MLNKNIISIKWYVESPIDFEYKQYKLLSYLQVVDSSFMNRCLSPHLLHMENMVREMYFFKSSFNDMKKVFDKNRYIYFTDNPKLENEDNQIIDEIIEIVEFSIPQVETRISLGNSILKKTNQILY
jgi:hypothetical protein